MICGLRKINNRDFEINANKTIKAKIGFLPGARASRPPEVEFHSPAQGKRCRLGMVRGVVDAQGESKTDSELSAWIVYPRVMVIRKGGRYSGASPVGMVSVGRRG